MAKNTFGPLLRATRLGYHLDPVLKAWVRVSRMAYRGLVDGAFLVEIIPEASPIPAEAGGVSAYICWWNSQGSITDHSVDLLALAPAAVPGEYVTDDSGNIIGQLVTNHGARQLQAGTIGAEKEEENIPEACGG